MLYVRVLSLKNCKINMCMFGASGHQKRVSDTLELEHQEVVVYDVGIKPEFVFLRETIALSHWELSLIQGEKKL